MGRYRQGAELPDARRTSALPAPQTLRSGYVGGPGRALSFGLSNKEVAAQCWVSPRTVAFHLRNVFAKAGVTSRGELARLDLG